MRLRVATFLASAALAACPTPAMAQEVFAGFFAHDIDTFFSDTIGEPGHDVVLGHRFEPIEGLDLLGQPAQPYVLASINTTGATSFAGGGLGWTLGKGRFYVRPGVGLMIHDGPDLSFDTATGERTDMGSRILFEPEMALGLRLNDRVAIEASWIHVSHARLLNTRQNPGLDLVGVRLSYRLR